MTIICAWCKKVLGVKPPLENTDETHGVCKDCETALKKKYKIIGPLYWDDIERIEKALASKPLF